MLERRFKTREFLTEVVELVRMQLPADLKDVQVVGPTGSLIKLHYGDPHLHYEVWVSRRQRVVEVGLHFEGPPEKNSWYLSQLVAGYPEAIESLGPEVVPEEWVRSWTRVHQLVAFDSLDEDLLMVVSGRLNRMVRTLEPAVKELSATWAG